MSTTAPLPLAGESALVTGTARRIGAARGVAPVSSALRQRLERLGLAKYGDRFEADDIDLDVVTSLSEQDLEKLGVSMGHRKGLLMARDLAEARRLFAEMGITGWDEYARSMEA